MNKKTKTLLIVLLGVLAIAAGVCIGVCRRGVSVDIAKTDLPGGSWQAQVTFPDWKGYVDDTLAMNSTYGFDGCSGQGTLYFTVSKGVKDFDLFINNTEINTKSMRNGTFAVDISKIAKNGANSVQVTNITKSGEEDNVTVSIPYPAVINGTPKEVGLSDETFSLISDIIEADIENGYTSAQLAVVKNGKLVYENAWGTVNAYGKDGKPVKSAKVTTDTLYDLASNTKMYAVAYAIQYLYDNEKISLDDRIVDIIGTEFVDSTAEIPYAAYENGYPGLDVIKDWKSRVTVKDLLMHRAGFPDTGHYHNQKFDAVNGRLSDEVDNILYVENATKEKTLKEGICKTPLLYEPGTDTAYSDIDYMLLGLIVEKITGKDLNTFLSETFWKPMGLTHVTYEPLKNGFKKEDCAATELCGNTRDGRIDFPRVRTDTVWGEVHDEEAYYTMEGVSGHAGLFASAGDLARLASVMLTGGYGNNRFFSKNTRDLFISPQAGALVSYGIGWWREADDRRAFYFGTGSPESTVGHQGWTGTLTMIDFENDLVAVYLTNIINTPVKGEKSLATANDFAGWSYTSATLGFVPQIIYTGMDNGGRDLEAALSSLARDMAAEKEKLVAEKEKETGGALPEDHRIKRAKKAIDAVAKKWN